MFSLAGVLERAVSARLNAVRSYQPELRILLAGAAVARLSLWNEW
jgi:hypothetical protein